MKFQRQDAIEEIGYIYTAAAGLEPGFYRVKSLAICTFMFETVVGYIVEHEGKLRRLWMS